MPNTASFMDNFLPYLGILIIVLYASFLVYGFAIIPYLAKKKSGNKKEKTLPAVEVSLPLANLEITKVKIIVTAPEEAIEKIRNAMCEAGAGVIGNYTYCSTSIKSVGTFRPNDVAHPYIGEKDKMELVKEERLEIVCDVAKVKNVISELRKNHPYEEPAIDIVLLLDEKYFE